MDLKTKLLKAFNGSYINGYDEFIALPEYNIYFMLKDCKTLLDVKCKIIEWFVRPIYKGDLCVKYFDYSMFDYKKEKLDELRNEVDFYWCDIFEMSDHNFRKELCKNRNGGLIRKEMGIVTTQREYFKNSMELILEHELLEDDLEVIYQRLGNSCNRELTIKFIESGFDMKVLEKK